MRSKVSKTIDAIMVIIYLTLFVFSFYRVIDWNLNNGKNEKINKNLHKYIKEDNNESFAIDFKKITKLNKDAVAYIKVNNTYIDYVVLKTDNNDYYKTHNFNRNKNKAGWIFVDYRNKLDGADKNIVVYGLKTIDRGMFSSLKNTLDSDWQKNNDNRIVLFATENSVEKYEVFSTYVSKSKDYIKIDFNEPHEFSKYIQTIKKKSMYDYGTKVDENDQILTLSTCSGKKRIVLHAKRIV